MWQNWAIFYLWFLGIISTYSFYNVLKEKNKSPYGVEIILFLSILWPIVMFLVVCQTCINTLKKEYRNVP